MLKARVIAYMQLMRWDRPIGFFLLLWPTLWGLWLASTGFPNGKLLFIFIVGVLLMRSAGCVINDVFDRRFDSLVKRTKDRPLASARVSVVEALCLFGVLCLGAFFLVLQLNFFTILLAVAGALLMLVYPLMKRITDLPQVVLGVVFGGWPVLMAFAAQSNTIPTMGWQLFFAASLWPIAYDTMYAMVDREDDRQIGVKSTALWLGQYDKRVILIIQLTMLALLINLGISQGFHYPFYIALGVAASLIAYQHYLIKDRKADQCFKAFLNNQWFGMVVFIGIYLSLNL